MNSFDFDTIYDRRIAGDVKYTPVSGLPDLIPMWIADMDFKAPPCVEAAVRQVAARATLR